MKNEKSSIYLGGRQTQVEARPVEGGYVSLFGETYYRIRNYDHMPPFFMSLVSSADHWLFISSRGGLTAGRTNPESALFPYETDDKIAANSAQTGNKTLMLASRNGRTQLWEPFSDRYTGIYRCERSLYKNIYGNKLIFEEINHDLRLTYRYAWRTGDRFGFIKSSWLHNGGDDLCRIALIDGLQNLMPYGATTAMQSSFSNLLTAYKRNELDPSTGLGLFSLSAIPTDRAEPREALKATVAWQIGLDPGQHLLCTDQLDRFRRGLPLSPEQDVPGKTGAYLVKAILTLAPDQSRPWHIVADVNQDSRDVVRLRDLLRPGGEAIATQLEADIDQGTAELIAYVASADGLQLSAAESITTHHFANVLFNIMRGGIFADSYQVDKKDLLAFMRTRNRPVLASQAVWFEGLPDKIGIRDLYARAASANSVDLERLCYEYLPLIFSRRHGDPSRPWNRFSINLKHPDGSPRLDYQGNWRDIFQNWEALAYAFPAYIEGMIAKFLNATTPDGYNPYRVTRDGIEWEVPEPKQPWANIGYWSDHQIIYLQKLLEFAEALHPGILPSLWDRPIFSYANVPYRLHAYEQMLADWYNTIDFDRDTAQATATAVAAMGTDGRLCRDGDGAVIHVTMGEKLLVLLLAKLTNLVPGGGIWMNTQRPEWNDANNALVGKGMSVVTAAYLRRFIAFWQTQLAKSEAPAFRINGAVMTLLGEVQTILAEWQPQLETGFTAKARRAMMDALGAAATAYRSSLYRDGLPPEQREVTKPELGDFLALAQVYIEYTLRANRRPDSLFHAYNILRLDRQSATIDHLYLMLEGQVAILSSGMLTPEEALELLNSLRWSDLYRPDQHSYLLYPNRSLPGFRQKNNIAAGQVADSALVAALTRAGDQRLITLDDTGTYHFNGMFRHANDVVQMLTVLGQEPAYAELVTAERSFILDLFETVFDHRSFTGRSGTFFAFEGLGSIYWHMVSKLLLAVQESHTAAVNSGAEPSIMAALADAYYDIRQGLGFNKSPELYGAFPVDPYSHSPAGSGARQPGMTGQVKEEILTRLGELGVTVTRGELHFKPTLLRSDEFLPEPGHFTSLDIQGNRQTVSLPANSLAFTFCQTPIIYTRTDTAAIEVTTADGRLVNIPGTGLDVTTSRHIFERSGQIRLVHAKVILP